MPCLALFVVLTHTAPDLSDSQILRFVCGIRPCRTGGLRLEIERVAGKHVVHNYGHGGAGVTLSWGCAREAAALVLEGLA